VAVGQYEATTAGESGLLETESGGRWQADRVPAPVGAEDVVLNAVSCPASGVCVATGIYRDGSGNTVGLIATLGGGTWRSTTAPLPIDAAVNPSVSIDQVSCGAPGSCTVAGEYSDEAGHVQGLILSLSGTTWRPVRAPVPPGAAADPSLSLFGLSCPPSGACVAVGSYADAAGHTEALAESVDGTTVTATSVPVPDNARTGGTDPEPGSRLAGVACPAANVCVATGAYTSTVNAGADARSSFIDTLSGGRWSTAEAPGSFAPSASAVLGSVSCSWPGSCAAVGEIYGADSDSVFVETLSHGTWTETTNPLPPDVHVPAEAAVGPAGEPISCAGGACVVAGTYLTTTGGEPGLLITSPNLSGYQLAASDGGLFAYNAPFYGSLAGSPLNRPVVGMAVVPDTGGYYEVASDGGVFAFHAPFLGSMGGAHLNAPIVGVAFDSWTGGYYEVAADGGIFAFDAPYYGSLAGSHLNKPIVGIAFDPWTGGYYEVASDGGVFAFHAPFAGSTGGTRLNRPVVGIGFG
jgi:hypothetical protein